MAKSTTSGGVKKRERDTPIVPLVYQGHKAQAGVPGAQSPGLEYQGHKVQNVVPGARSTGVRNFGKVKRRERDTPIVPLEYQGHKARAGVPGAQSPGLEYQGHKVQNVVPGAQSPRWSTRGTKCRMWYQGHEVLAGAAYVCSRGGVLKSGST